VYVGLPTRLFKSPYDIKMAFDRAITPYVGVDSQQVDLSAVLPFICSTKIMTNGNLNVYFKLPL
jgi:hypothetical protein